jgi:hypothetical protein
MEQQEGSVSLSESVRKAFTDSAVQEHAEEFLSGIRSTMQESDKNMRRAAAYILLLAFLFELIGRGGVGELSLGLAKLTDNNVVRGVIPLAVAYLYTELAAALCDYTYLYGLYQEIMKTAYKPIHDNRLVESFIPFSSLTYGAARPVQFVTSPWTSFYALAAGARLAVLFVGPLAFEAYAFLKLFQDIGLHNLLLWINLAGTTLLVTIGIASLFAFHFSEI